MCIACRLLKEPDAASDAAAADEDAADDDDEEEFGESVLVAERTVDRQILDAILQAGVHPDMMGLTTSTEP